VAMQKMDRRIRRYTQRMKDHHLQAQAKQAESAAYFVLRPTPDEEGDEEGELAFPEPIVVAETERPVRTLTVAMAVMELDLTESQTIVFRNAAHGGLSVVYRRSDGNIGWIDPERGRGSSGDGPDGTAAAL